MHQTHKAIGILGGTFDPIHIGHLRLALELYETLDLAKVHLIPCYQPVHRKRPVASALHRLNMVKCAVEGSNALCSDDREINRQGPSYMIDTLLDIRKEMPNIPLCLLLGIDTFLGFPSWHRFEEILEQAHIVIAHRPQYHLPTTGIVADLVKSRYQQENSFIHENLAGGILLRPITALEISATEIRKQITIGKSPRYLVPDSVYDYIKQNSIYSIPRI